VKTAFAIVFFGAGLVTGVIVAVETIIAAAKNPGDSPGLNKLADVLREGLG
jgi:hypothetical protein